jgi:hypothetical protein
VIKQEYRHGKSSRLYSWLAYRELVIVGNVVFEIMLGVVHI